MTEQEYGSGWETQDMRALREHAESLKADLDQERAQRAQEAEELDAFRRRDRFASALMEAQIDGISFEDVADLPTEQITATALRIRAEEKQAARGVAEERQAKELGFETVDEYRATISAVKTMRAEERQSLAAATAIVGSQAPPVAPVTKTPQEHAMDAYKEARAQGLPEDMSKARYAQALQEATNAMAARSAEGAVG